MESLLLMHSDEWLRRKELPRWCVWMCACVTVGVWCCTVEKLCCFLLTARTMCSLWLSAAPCVEFPRIESVQCLETARMTDSQHLLS